jgi:hypothetical protein
MTMIDVSVVLRLDQEDVRALGLNDALNAGDKCHIMGIAEVTKATRGLNGPGTAELKLVKIGVRDVERQQEPEEPMVVYAKRRNAEMRER